MNWNWLINILSPFPQLQKTTSGSFVLHSWVEPMPFCCTLSWGLTNRLQLLERLTGHLLPPLRYHVITLYFLMTVFHGRLLYFYSAGRGFLCIILRLTITNVFHGYTPLFLPPFSYVFPILEKWNFWYSVLALLWVHLFISFLSAIAKLATEKNNLIRLHFTFSFDLYSSFPILSDSWPSLHGGFVPFFGHRQRPTSTAWHRLLAQVLVAHWRL